MSLKHTLLGQFNAYYDERNWYVSLKTALDGVTAEQAA